MITYEFVRVHLRVRVSILRRAGRAGLTHGSRRGEGGEDGEREESKEETHDFAAVGRE